MSLYKKEKRKGEKKKKVKKKIKRGIKKKKRKEFALFGFNFEITQNCDQH